MDPTNILTMATKEIKDAAGNRWFILFTAAFSTLAAALGAFAVTGTSFAGVSVFGRTAASLINLTLLFVPLISLTVGALSIASERESGTLSYLLSHPITRTELFLGKFLGLFAATSLSIVLGFGLAGILISLKAGTADMSSYVTTILVSILLAASMLSLGLLVSASSGNGAKATAVALFLWLAVTLLGDLGILGATVAFQLGPKGVFTLTLLNPAAAFKIAATITLSHRYDVLGPVGTYMVSVFGPTEAFAVLVASLAAWTVVPLGAAMALFMMRKEP